MSPRLRPVEDAPARAALPEARVRGVSVLEQGGLRPEDGAGEPSEQLGARRSHGTDAHYWQHIANLPGPNGTPHYRSPRYKGYLLALDSYQRLVGEWTEICRLNMFRSRSSLRQAGGLVTARGV